MISPDTHNSDNREAVLQKDKPDTKQKLEAPALPSGLPQFATRGKQGTGQQFSQNKLALIGAGAVVFALLVFVLTSSQKHKPVTAAKTGAAAAVQTNTANQTVDNAASPKSVSPVTDSGRPASGVAHNGFINEQDVERTATRQPPAAKIPQGSNLGSLPPFDGPQGAWQAPPPTNVGGGGDNDVSKSEKDVDQPSLVFVQKATQTSSGKTADPSSVDTGLGLGLPTGTRLRARLEVAASTAVKIPVIAVVEYNYEKDGEIVVPAGAKAFGHIEQADRSGYLSIRFDSLLMPDGASTPIEAVATDIGLRPLKGKVEGKNTGKNALVRSLSGVGQVGALFAGRGGGLSQPFSEGDLIRERLSTNIGETADQEITRLALTEHIAVSISANTPIYVVLDHGTKSGVTRNAQPLGSSPAASQNLESLRQLLQLQRELNQTAEANPHP